MPVAKILTERICGVKELKNLSSVPMTNDNAWRQIQKMAYDVKKQITSNWNNKFSLQLGVHRFGELH